MESKDSLSYFVRFIDLSLQVFDFLNSAIECIVLGNIVMLFLASQNENQQIFLENYFQIYYY